MKKNRSITLRKRLITLSIGSGISALLLMSQPILAATSSIKHIVKSGETLSQLAVQYQVSQTQIIDANGLSASHLHIGQVLNIPNAYTPTIYKVQPGDSLYSVAQEYNTTTTELARINNIPTNAQLDIADTLILPDNVKTTPNATNTATASKSNVVSNTKATTSKAKVSASGKHRVMRGETLIKIANDYGVSLSELTRANNINIDTMIRFGELLTIPSSNSTASSQQTTSNTSSRKSAPTTYTVKSGDGLIVIAKKFNIDFMDLAKENGLEGYETLRVGQVLKLPKGATTSE